MDLFADEMSKKEIGRHKAFKNFITHESFGGILLFFCVITAMLIANSNFSYLYFETLETYLDFKFGSSSLIHVSLIHFINDVLMSFFFLMVGLEMKREVLYGELAGFKSVSFSVFAAIGGLICPVLMYLFFTSGTPSYSGFGASMSTDTAFALGVILLLGKRIPSVIKTFIVTLAVADDLGAIGVIAIFYTDTISMGWIYISLLLVVLLIVFNYMDIKYISMYFAVGIVLWFCLFFSGVHATIGAVVLALIIPGKSQISRHSFLGLKEAYNRIYFDMKPEASIFTPAKSRPDSIIGAIAYCFADFFSGAYQNIKNFMSSKSDAQREIDMEKEHKRVEILDTVSRYSRYAQNPLVRIEYILQPLNAYFVVPIFAFANAGVSISSGLDFGVDNIMLAIVVGLVLGKPIGIFICSLLSEKIGISKRPEGLTNAHILSIGFLCGIGFTISMFVSNIAFNNNHAAMSLAKLAILLASLIAAILGIFGLLISTKKNSEDKIIDDE